MALVSRIGIRRKSGCCQVSRHAESCEARALLSVTMSNPSAGIAHPLASFEYSSDDSEGPEGDGIGEALSSENFGAPVDGCDPAWLYPTLTPVSEESPGPSEGPWTLEPPASTAPEGWTEEQWHAWYSGPMTQEQIEQLGIVFEPIEEWSDATVVETAFPEGWDPSWLFPIELGDSDGEEPETVIFDVGSPEDPALDWANGPGGEDPADSLGPEGESVDGEVVDINYESMGPDGELVKDDLDWSWVLRGPPERDQISADNAGIPHSVGEPEVYYAMSFGTVGGADIRQSLDADELSPAPTPLFIPVATRTTALFGSRDTAGGVAALIAKSEEPAVAVSEPVPQPVSPVLRSKSRGLSVSSVKTNSEGLNGLTPLFENSDKPVVPKSRPADSDELPADETVSVIENHAGSDTDQFMVQYAQNSFMG